DFLLKLARALAEGRAGQGRRSAIERPARPAGPAERVLPAGLAAGAGLIAAVLPALRLRHILAQRAAPFAERVERADLIVDRPALVAAAKALDRIAHRAVRLLQRAARSVAGLAGEAA